MADQEMDAINRWIDGLDDRAEDIAKQAYSIARGSHRGGELPKYLRGNWDALPKEYREFLVFVARHALNH